MTSHFSHSIIGLKLLHTCQSKHDLPETTPPKDNDTRTGWSGAYLQSAWYRVHQEAVQMYDLENPRKAANAAASPDGSVYKDHKLVDVQWDIVNESVYILNLSTECINLLQGTEYATANLALPLIGSLAHKLHALTPGKYEKQLMECKLEDFCVAACLDPRYKDFEFKYVNKWNKGTLNVEKAQGWARSCWQNDWRPIAQNGAVQDPASMSKVSAPQKSTPAKKHARTTVASFLDNDSEDEISEPIVAEKAEDEFEKYMSLPVAKKHTDPLVWWKAAARDLPHMAKMARQFLAAPASTAGVERAFSACGQMHSDLRKCLKEGTIEHALMAAMN
ncbi:hypothetical protein CYMTET_45004 [Cymbomonas tetramitiformis]|uniref:HAT C-terminal dimerisation domain-containing protein n=1 Tax=Cymbomonas tetramitiformis TaxID=36881 RepID=A0AAE0EYR5_9CHLO|nr:hypothetical protein CYMTET_45004 [Cymbomonas tetramitiformis]